MSAGLVEVLLAISRWLTFASVVALVGAAGAQFVAARLTAPDTGGFRACLDQRLPRLAATAAMCWLVALLGVWAVMALSWFGPDAFTDRERLTSMIADSRWGQAWLTAFVTCVIANAALGLARGRLAWHRRIVTLSAIAAIVTTPLIGHAGAQGAAIRLLHAGHLAGAGLWLGTLLMLSWPTWALWRDHATAGGLGNLLSRFTPVALTGAGIVVASGALLTASQIWPVTLVFDTAYGNAIVRKVVAVLMMAGLGWLNWRHFRPAAHVEGRRRLLRHAVRAEIALGFLVVLAITAWLSGLPTPLD